MDYARIMVEMEDSKTIPPHVIVNEGSNEFRIKTSFVKWADTHNDVEFTSVRNDNGGEDRKASITNGEYAAKGVSKEGLKEIARNGNVLGGHTSQLGTVAFNGNETAKKGDATGETILESKEGMNVAVNINEAAGEAERGHGLMNGPKGDKNEFMGLKAEEGKQPWEAQGWNATVAVNEIVDIDGSEGENAADKEGTKTPNDRGSGVKRPRTLKNNGWVNEFELMVKANGDVTTQREVAVIVTDIEHMSNSLQVGEDMSSPCSIVPETQLDESSHERWNEEERPRSSGDTMDKERNGLVNKDTERCIVVFNNNHEAPTLTVEEERREIIRKEVRMMIQEGRELGLQFSNHGEELESEVRHILSGFDKRFRIRNEPRTRWESRNRQFA